MSMLSMSHELFVTYNTSSLFLELLSNYTKAVDRDFIKIIKIKQTSADILKLQEIPFMITLTGDIVHGEVILAENIAKISGLYETLYGRSQEEVYSHLNFFKIYNENAKVQSSALNFMNKHLLKNTFCNGSHITISDLFAYAHIVCIIATLPDSDKWLYSNIIRWIDHIQNLSGLKEKIKEFRLKVSLPYVPLFFEDESVKVAGEGKKDTKKDAKKEAKEAFLAKGGMIKNEKKEEKIVKEEAKEIVKEEKKEIVKVVKEEKIATSTTTPVSKPTENNTKKADAQPQTQKPQKNAPKAKDPLDDAHPVSKLDIRVGKVISIAVNEKSEKLYNEEVDMGNGEIRKIASGLKGRVNIEDLKDSLVIILANLKERALCGWPSHGMILCASDEQGNIEPIRPPVGSQPGDLVSIGDYPRTPVAELNPKKSPWEAVQPEMTVVDSNVATYQKTSVWKTDKGEIKTKSLINAKIS